MNLNIVEATLTTDDMPGSELSESFSKHKVDSLCQWLLCCGIQVPKSWNKSQVTELVWFLSSVAVLFHQATAKDTYTLTHVLKGLLLFSLHFRMSVDQQEAAPLVDVDGSYLYKKHRTINEAGNEQLHFHCQRPPCLVGEQLIRIGLIVSVHLFQLSQIVSFGVSTFNHSQCTKLYVQYITNLVCWCCLFRFVIFLFGWSCGSRR